MLRQARIAQLEEELAALKRETTETSLTYIKKLFYNTYGEKHYDVYGWNTYVLDGTVYRSTGPGYYRHDEYFTLILYTTNCIIRFMYSMTGCHEDIHHHISVLSDKSLYSAQMCQNETAPEWDVIKRVKDIPTVCNEFERNIIITMGEIEHDYLFFNINTSSIELPFINKKYKPFTKLPKGVFYYLQDDYDNSGSESESLEEEEKENVNGIAPLI